MKKIKIFALTLGVGGIEKYTATLCKMLDEDYDIEIICTYKVSEKPAFAFSNRVKIRYLIYEKPDAVSLKQLLRNRKLFSACDEIRKRIKRKYLSVKRNREAIENLDCDYLITTRIFHDKLVHKYLKNKNIITIATDHNHHQNNKKYIRDLIQSVSSFHYLVVPTQELYDFYKSMLKNTKCLLIPNALDNISNHKVDFSSHNFISVGRFSPEKGFLDLIDVFQIIHKQLPDAKLFLLGDGFQKNEIELKIRNYGLENNIILPGYVVEKEQKEYYFKSSIYLMTSYTECFGLVLLEAMSYGVPCISFDSASGAKYLLKKDVGILVKNRDKECMAKEAINVIKNKKRLITYQKNINHYINKFSQEEISKEWKKLLRKSAKK